MERMQDDAGRPVARVHKGVWEIEAMGGGARKIGSKGCSQGNSGIGSMRIERADRRMEWYGRRRVM